MCHVCVALKNKYQAVMMQGEILRKGAWLQEEDEQLTSFVTRLGERRWDSLAKVAGLRRNGKSCRLRWLNYLRPNLKHGSFSVEEELLILQLQQQWGNKWSKISRRLPGRTDNDIKNYWRTHLRKRVEQVQEEGKLKYEVENIAQHLNEKSIDEVPKDCSHIHVYSEDSEGETKDSYKDSTTTNTELCSSNWGMRESPYETRVLDWMTEMQNGYECNETYYYDYNLPLEFHEGCEIWDYSSFLWNL